ncbi:MAG: DUF2608 domain-containing protein [Verrucomicrobia bacterium]|nr:DUF2608 domain-containing protein [Verrucomicrobiota bacterium]
MFLLDLDDTLIDHRVMIGSKFWRKYLLTQTTQEKHDLLTLFVSKHYPTRAIEGQVTTHFVENHQQAGHPVFGYTARELNAWYYTPYSDTAALTKRQLQQAGIDFTKTVCSDNWNYLKNVPGFSENIFYITTDTKGEYIISPMLQNAPCLPIKVVFVDDRGDHAETVGLALASLGIDYEVYVYEGGSVQFDSAIADIQLYYLWTHSQVLSDDEAREVLSKLSDKDTSKYLQEVIAQINTIDDCF